MQNKNKNLNQGRKGKKIYSILILYVFHFFIIRIYFSNLTILQ